MATADAGLTILGSRDAECVTCGTIGKLHKFMQWFTDRAGLKVVHCRCPQCDASWKRIEPIEGKA